MATADPHIGAVSLLVQMDGANGGTTFTDVKGSTVTPVNAPTTTTATYPALTGKTSSGSFASGSSRYLSVPYKSAFNFGSSPGTIEFWMYPLVTAGDHGIFCMSNATSWCFSLAVNAGTTLKLLKNNTGGGYDVGATISSATVANTWQHVAVCFSGTILTLYVGGVLKYTSGAVSAFVTPTTPFYIGYQPINNTYFDGCLAEFRITTGVQRYTSAFTPPTAPFPNSNYFISGTVKNATDVLTDRVVRVYRRDSGALVGTTVSNAVTGAFSVNTADTTEHFAVVHDTDGDPYWNNVVLAMHMDGANASTTFTDKKGHAMTAVGNAQISTTQSKFGGSSAYFDGTGDVITLADSPDWDFGAGDFTIEMFVYLNTMTLSILISKRLINSNYCSVVLHTNAAGDLITYLSTTGTSWLPLLRKDGLLTVNTWYHIALVRQGSTFSLYVNGQNRSGSVSSSAALMVNTSTLNIGANADATLPFNGYIDDLRITKGVARYTADFTPQSSAFSDSALSTGTLNALIYDNLIPV